MTDHARDAGSSETRAQSVPSGANGSDDRIESRLRAVERAVAGSEARPGDIADDAEAAAERERLESRLTDLEERVAELEAATQAVRGYAGAVRAVNREVERRADLALSRATTATRATDGDEGNDFVAEFGQSDLAVESSEGDLATDTEADGSGARSGRDPTSTAAGGEAVPSESALDAALPDDRPGSEPRGDDDGSGEGGDGAWATAALDRLRESL